MEAIKRFSFPFAFIVPSGYEYGDHGRPLPCRMLPPSFNTDKFADGSMSLHLYPKLSVFYQLHAILRYHDEGSMDATSHAVEATEEINFLPYSEVQPPLDLESFPEEFILATTIKIKRHFLDGRPGSIVLQASEPLPLVYYGPTSIASTECILSMTVYAMSFSLQRLRALSLDIKLAIRMKIFYSSRPIDCMPKQTSLARNRQLQLYDRTVKLEEQQFSQLEWDFSPPTPREAHISRQETSGSGGGRSSTSSAMVSNDSDGVTMPTSCLVHIPSQDTAVLWSTGVRISIKPSEALLPAFCSALVSTSYSLLIRARIRGAYSSPADLEIPIQVVHLSASPTVSSPVASQDSSSCVGPAALLAEEDVSLLLMIRNCSLTALCSYCQYIETASQALVAVPPSSKDRHKYL
jgi:hypothetical protein